MKDIPKIAAVLAAASAAAVFIRGAAEAVPQSTDTLSPESISVTEENSTSIYRCMGSSDFYIFRESDGEVIKLTQEEYIIGAVLAEMPADYPEEALMAQAAAVGTYAVRRREEELVSPSEELRGGYISDDPEKYRIPLDEKSARKLYGESYTSVYEKVSAAVGKVSDKVLLYNGEPVAAAFHAVSSGKTESAENVWGTAVGCLVPVDSSFDSNSPDFLTVNKYTSAEVFGRFSAEYPDLTFSRSAAEELYISEKTRSDTVLYLRCGDTDIKGSDFQRIFSLPSAAFELSFDNDTLTVTSKGRGNGVGMSGYGAKYLAENGYTYDEILKYYYMGIEIASLEFSE